MLKVSTKILLHGFFVYVLWSKREISTFINEKIILEIIEIVMKTDKIKRYISKKHHHGHYFQ
jgi:hypothetical protein